jgi:hypothetical protein
MYEDHATITLHPPLQLGIRVTASLYITAEHCRQSTNFPNGPRIYFTDFETVPLSKKEWTYLHTSYEEKSRKV